MYTQNEKKSKFPWKVKEKRETLNEYFYNNDIFWIPVFLEQRVVTCTITNKVELDKKVFLFLCRYVHC